jgi:protein-S-isoprenylcysteine O-methyltransferase Ste14
LSLRYILSKVSEAAAAIFLYLPVIARIITPMIWILPAWYVSWYLLSYIIPFSNTWPGVFIISWDPVSHSHNTQVVVASLCIGLITFTVGSLLFLYALVTMIRTRSAKNGLATSGPYKWIRHPQHLGIILMLFLPVLDFYGIDYLSIRLGDLVSLFSLAFLLILVADLEEIGLAKKFGDDFQNYCSVTPFMLPLRTPQWIKKQLSSFPTQRYVRYLFAFILFWIFMTLLSYAFTFLHYAYVK